MRSLLFAVTCIAPLLFAAPSFAAPITAFAAAQFEPVSGDFPGPDPIAVSGTFTPFDSSLGTLVSVRLSTGGTGAAGVMLTNLLPGQYQVQVWARFSLLSPGDIVLDTLDQAQGRASFTMQENGTSDSIWADANTAPFSAFALDGNSLGSPFSGITSGLDHFLSLNQFTITFEYFLTVSGPSFSSTGTVLDPDITYLDFVVGGVYFTYEPVPEPSTALLVGLGLTWVGVVQSRKRV